MKIILFCLSFYLTPDFISAVDTFNAQTDNTSTIFQPDSHFHGLAYQLHAHRSFHAVNNISNRVNQSTRSQSQSNKHPPPDHLQNTTTAPLNNRAVHPKFRPWLYPRQNDMSLIELQPDNERTLMNTTAKSSNLRQHLTLKPRTLKSPSSAGSYFERKFHAFFGHPHDEYPAPTRSNIKTGLR